MRILKKTLKALAKKCGYTIIKTTNLEEPIRLTRLIQTGSERNAAGQLDLRHESSYAVINHDPQRLFQPLYYQTVYPDIDYFGLSPFEHYMMIGWKEGKNPNPFFYSQWYMKKYPEAGESGLDPLSHYLDLGTAKDYDPSPRFSTRAYKTLYPEIGAANPLFHYLVHGIPEGHTNVPVIAEPRVLANLALRIPPVAAQFINSLADDYRTIDRGFTEEVLAVMAASDPNAMIDAVFKVGLSPDVIHCSRVFMTYGQYPDTFAQGWLLYLAYLRWLDKGNQYLDIIARTNEEWKRHPVFSLALALLNIARDDPMEFKIYAGQVDSSFLAVYYENLLLRHYEASFVRGQATKTPTWYYDASGQYCDIPWQALRCQMSRDAVRVLTCSSDYSPLVLQTEGGLTDSALNAVFGSRALREFRRSVLDGDYSYCNRLKCPFIYRHELSGQMPPGSSSLRHLLLSFDRSCNLRCPSCREGYIHSSEQTQRKLIDYYDLNIQPHLAELAKGESLTVQMDGLGEAMVSPVGRHIFTSLAQCSDTVKVSYMTNGQLLTPSAWAASLSQISVRISEIVVSIDAGDAEGYEKLRYPGKWKTLMANMDFLSQMAKEKKITLAVCLVMQKENLGGVMPLLELCAKWNVREFFLQRYYNPGFYDDEVFRAMDVLAPTHPDYETALTIVKNAHEFCRANEIRFSPKGNIDY
jgi:molybdenum cofactor biosynthesis enzyme MoaA